MPTNRSEKSDKKQNKKEKPENAQTMIMYYDYHAVARKLIKEGHLVAFEKRERWGNIAPAFVLFFDCHRPMPIREQRVAEYVEWIKESPSSHLVRRGDTEE